jgi:hypothetical protein
MRSSRCPSNSRTCQPGERRDLECGGQARRPVFQGACAQPLPQETRDIRSRGPGAPVGHEKRVRRQRGRVERPGRIPAAREPRQPSSGHGLLRREDRGPHACRGQHVLREELRKRRARGRLQNVTGHQQAEPGVGSDHPRAGHHDPVRDQGQLLGGCESLRLFSLETTHERGIIEPCREREQLGERRPADLRRQVPRIRRDRPIQVENALLCHAHRQCPEQHVSCRPQVEEAVRRHLALRVLACRAPGPQQEQAVTVNEGHRQARGGAPRECRPDPGVEILGRESGRPDERARTAAGRRPRSRCRQEQSREQDREHPTGRRKVGESGNHRTPPGVVGAFLCKVGEGSDPAQSSSEHSPITPPLICARTPEGPL